MPFKDFSLFVNDTKVGEPFAEALKSGKIFASRCDKCGRMFFPPRPECPDCLTEDISYVEAPTQGKLLSFTAVFIPPAHYAASPSKMPFSKVTQTPCPVGVVAVAGDLRIMGWIPGMALRDIKVGSLFDVEAKTLKNGQLTIILSPV